MSAPELVRVLAHTLLSWELRGRAMTTRGHLRPFLRRMLLDLWAERHLPF